jgi:DNA-binding transcriptional ArsR family regulator
MANIHPIEALGDPTRRRLFERLREGSCSVNELVEVVSVSQPAVSQHLKVLKAAQLVWVEKQGQQRIYHLNPTGLARLRQYVESLWEDVLGAFGEEAAKMSGALEQEKPEKSEHSHSGEVTKAHIFKDREKKPKQEDR